MRGSPLPRTSPTSASRTSPVPQLKAPDDVLVEVLWCGICGTDLHEYLVGPIVTPDDARTP